MSCETFEVSASGDRAVMGLAEVPEVFGCRLSDFTGGGPEVEITWQVVDGSPVCRDVHLRAVDTGREVQRSDMAGVRLEDLLERTVKALMWTAGAARHLDPGKWLPVPQVEREVVRAVQRARSSRKPRITNAVLAEVAAVYRGNVSDMPTRAVAEHLGVQPRTARLYVRRARDANLLGAAIKGKAGEQ